MFSWLKGKKKPAAEPTSPPDTPTPTDAGQEPSQQLRSTPRIEEAATDATQRADRSAAKTAPADRTTAEELSKTTPAQDVSITEPATATADLDPVLAPLTATQGGFFRAKFKEHLAAHGIEATTDQTHAHTAQGAQFGYDSLLHACLETGNQDHWDEVMKEYCGKVAEALTQSGTTDESFEKLGPEAVICKVISPERFAEFGVESYGYGPKFADELPVVATLDTPAMTSYLPLEVISASSSVNAAVQSGLTNLANLIDSAELDFEHHNADGVTITFVGGPSVYTASFALFLPLVIHRIQPEADLSAGVLFTLTEDHRITYHICTKVDAVHHATVELVRMAHQQLDDAERVLSPHVYFYRNSVTSVLRCTLEDGGVRIAASDHFTEAWNDLAQE